MVGHDKSVLEVGCGPGSQSRVLRDLGCRVVGLEIDASRAALAREFCERVHVTDIEATALGDLLGNERFDVITCTDVLEHLRAPAGAVRRLAPFLNAGGYLLASIPNVTHASVVFEMAHGRFEYRDIGLLDNTHVRFFCRRTALSLMESAGFVVAEIHSTTLHPRDTEFRTAPYGGDDGVLMSLIQKFNPDSFTYQFVLKAYPTIDTDGTSRNALLVGEQLRRLEEHIAHQQREIGRLNAAIAWLESGPAWRAYRRLRAALRIS